MKYKIGEVVTYQYWNSNATSPPEIVLFINSDANYYVKYWCLFRNEQEGNYNLGFLGPESIIRVENNI